MGITESIFQRIIHLIDTTGYPGIGFLMMLESMVAPVPSEGVMPFAGCLIASGRFTFFWVAVWSTLGSIVGSWLSYVVGYYGGRPFVTRFGKYLLLNLHDLEVTERFFHRRGSITIFIARFVPVIRHLISIPAGVGKMNPLQFTVYTVVGACIWNVFLAWLGYHMGTHWELIHQYSRQIDVFMIIPVSVAVYFFVKTHMKRKASRA